MANMTQAQANLDSLLHVWNDPAQADTSRLKAIDIIILKNYLSDQPDSAFYYAEQAFEMAENGKHVYWMAHTRFLQSQSYLLRKLFDEALAYEKMSFTLKEALGNKKLIGNSYYNQGIIYFSQGDLQQAIPLFIQARKHYEASGAEDRLDQVNYIIGLCFHSVEESEKALEYYNESLKIRRKEGKRKAVASLLASIAQVNIEMGDTSQAITYNLQSLEAYEEFKTSGGRAVPLTSLANIYYEKGQYEKAISYCKQALEVFKYKGIEFPTTTVRRLLGKIYFALEQYDEALSHFLKIQEISQKYPRFYTMRGEDYQNLYKTYKAMGQYTPALEMHELYIQAQDSSQKTENTKAMMRFEVQAEYDKQKALDDLAFEKQKEQQRLILLGIGMGLLLSLIFAAIIWNRLKLTRRQKREIEAQKQLVEQSERYKEKFLANISHEFRTPLTVIMGMTEELEKNPDQAKKMIFRNSENLLGLINQLLDLSKLESGKLDLNLKQGNIIPYIQYLSESFQSFAETKDIELLFYQEVPELVMDYDEEKVQQIVSNLLSNAIKFSPQKGKVKVHVNARNQNGKEELILKVKDTGKGIDASSLPHIFDRFYQVDDSHTYKGEGTGIGLALAKELVEMMQGHISVTSEIGKGTEFTVVLPVNREAEPQAQEMPLLSKDMIRAEQAQPSFPLIAEAIANNQVLPQEELPLLLIIEDNPDVATYIETCLEGLYKIEKAENGQVGIDKAIEMVPDIIITDVMMPEKDGFEVCNLLKHDERTSHIPIVMLTAKASIEDRLTGLQRGADAYLVKPFNKQELYIRLQKLIELRQQLQKRYSGEALFDPTPTKEAPLEIEDAFLIKLMKIIEEHLDDSEFDIPKFCQEAGMSRTQMHRKLKALTDKSATHFIRSFRLRKAKELLQTTDLNVSEIAYDVGFQDPTYFSTSFLAEFGVSPSEVRTR
jgi:signal transduction histidine kinase/DNA-binding response OmpR family regulator